MRHLKDKLFKEKYDFSQTGICRDQNKNFCGRDMNIFGIKNYGFVAQNYFPMCCLCKEHSNDKFTHLLFSLQQ